MGSWYGHDVWSDKPDEKYRDRIPEGFACINIVTVLAFPLVTMLVLELPRLLLPGLAYHQHCVTVAGAGVFAGSRS